MLVIPCKNKAWSIYCILGMWDSDLHRCTGIKVRLPNQKKCAPDDAFAMHHFLHLCIGKIRFMCLVNSRSQLPHLFINVTNNLDQMQQRVNAVYYGYSNFCSRPPQKRNLLNRVPEHECQTLFVLHKTKCKPMHFEWKRFSDYFRSALK
jgi:hypothetical protein